MARWNHAQWHVAANSFVDGAWIATIGFAAEAKTARSGAPYRGYRIDIGADVHEFGTAFIDRGNIVVRLKNPVDGVTRIEFKVDTDDRAVPGTGRMCRHGAWSALPLLPEMA